MQQTITAPTSAELTDLQSKRTWVRDHYEPEARHKYEQSVEGKLHLLQTILDNGWIAANERLKLQCLGVAFGDALAQELALQWVMVEDEYGRDPALQMAGTNIRLFPLTMISKRVEDGQRVDVRALFQGLCARVLELRKDLAR